MLIRPAEIFDIPSIVALAEASWRVTYPGIISDAQIDYMLERMNQPSLFQQQMESQERIIFVAQIDDEVIGFVNTGVRQDASDTLKIYQLYIHPAAQCRGAGRQLIHVAQQEAAKRHCTILELNVNRGNPAYHFYVRQGFSICETVDIPYGPYVLNDYVMQRSNAHG